MTAVLVLLAALLQAAPVAPSAVSIRLSAAIVSVRTERQHQRQLLDRTAPKYPRISITPAVLEPIPPFPGFAYPHFQRPPPSRG